MLHQGPDAVHSVTSQRRLIDRFSAPLVRFARLEAAGGIVLVASAILALALANSGAAEAVHSFWTATPFTLHAGSWVFPSGKHSGNLEWWVNEGLMALFFFVIGLELKREFLSGELKDPRKAALPLIAALGGMLAPGLLYAALNWGTDGVRGWAIPTATDIAFALGVLALLGRRAPPGLRIFLVTLAIADDLGALVIIALFYTSSELLSLGSLATAGGIMALMAAMNLLGVRGWWCYGIVAVILWYFVLQSGVHATIAGVMAAMTIPVRTRISGAEFTRQTRLLADEFDSASELEPLANDAPPLPPLSPLPSLPPSWRSRVMIITSPRQQGVLRAIEQLAEGAQTPLQRIEKAMVPLATFVIVPVFALASAGVSIGGIAGAAATDRQAWGIVLGLVVGKTAGILGASALAVRLGICALPAGVSWRHMLGAALLGGIGFTMSLFIAHLAFGPSQRLEIAKLAVLSGSAISALLGALVLLSCKTSQPTGSH